MNIIAKSPTGRDVALRDDRYVLLLNCRHWYQTSVRLEQGGEWQCDRCRRRRIVVACISEWRP